MDTKKYPYVDRKFRQKNKLNIIINASIFASIAINSWIIYFSCDAKSSVIILAVIFTCLIAISVVDQIKGNNDLISNLLNGILYTIICVDYFRAYETKLLIVMYIIEVSILLTEVLLLKRRTKMNTLRK